MPFPIPQIISVTGHVVRSDVHRILGTHVLARLIKRFKPDVIHCFGATDGGLYAVDALDLLGGNLEGPRLVVQARGGPDLVDGCLDPALRPRLKALFGRCDLAICDNYPNYRRVAELGCPQERQFARPVPGAGGFNVLNDAITPPSKRGRVLYIPKAYEYYQSKLLPCLAALCSLGDDLRDTTIIATAVNDEAQAAIRRLPGAVCDRFVCYPRVSREQVLTIMKDARAVLAPSVLDGVPNVLYEAMAHGAVPIISPLDEIVEAGIGDGNALFARNLYPDDIAQGIKAALFDDVKADEIAKANALLVQRLANRAQIERDLVVAYRALARC